MFPQTTGQIESMMGEIFSEKQQDSHKWREVTDTAFSCAKWDSRWEDGVGDKLGIRDNGKL